MAFKVKNKFKQKNYYVVYSNRPIQPYGAVPPENFTNYKIEGQPVKADSSKEAYLKVKKEHKGYDYNVMETSKFLSNPKIKAKVLSVKEFK